MNYAFSVNKGSLPVFFPNKDFALFVFFRCYGSLSVVPWSGHQNGQVIFERVLNFVRSSSPSSIFRSNKRAARRWAHLNRPTRSTILAADCIFFSQLAWIVLSSCSMRDAKRSKISFSFSKRSPLRRRLNVFSSPCEFGAAACCTPKRSSATSRPRYATTRCVQVGLGHAIFARLLPATTCHMHGNLGTETHNSTIFQGHQRPSSPIDGYAPGDGRARQTMGPPRASIVQPQGAQHVRCLRFPVTGRSRRG